MLRKKSTDILIPLNNDFINDKKVNDLLYCWIQIHGKYNSNLKIRQIKCDNVNFVQIAHDLKICRQTVSNDFKYLINNNFLLLDGDNYLIPENCDNFVIVNSLVLNKLVESNVKNIIKVFCLIKRFYWAGKKESFFTYKILLDKIGYDITKTNNYTMISKIVIWLRNNLLLKYETIENGFDIKHNIIEI